MQHDLDQDLAPCLFLGVIVMWVVGCIKMRKPQFFFSKEGFNLSFF
jgi:hypothetical protein